METVADHDPRPPSVLPAAVLWDFDGTLVDSEQFWIAEEFALVRAHGGTWSDHHAESLVGNDLLTSGAYIRDNGPVPMEPADIVATLVRGVRRRLYEAIPWRPGVVELRAQVASAGILQGLVTMSYATVVEPVLSALEPAGMPPFDTVVTGDAVSRGKPDPEPYLLAARHLGVDPRDCVAVEDSLTGATSAAAAGCTVLVTPSALPVHDSPSWWVLPDLTGVGLAELAHQVAGRRTGR